MRRTRLPNRGSEPSTRWSHCWPRWPGDCAAVPRERKGLDEPSKTAIVAVLDRLVKPVKRRRRRSKAATSTPYNLSPRGILMETTEDLNREAGLFRRSRWRRSTALTRRQFGSAAPPLRRRRTVCREDVEGRGEVAVGQAGPPEIGKLIAEPVADRKLSCSRPARMARLGLCRKLCRIFATRHFPPHPDLAANGSRRSGYGAGLSLALPRPSSRGSAHSSASRRRNNRASAPSSVGAAGAAPASFQRPDEWRIRHRPKPRPGDVSFGCQATPAARS